MGPNLWKSTLVLVVWLGVLSGCGQDSNDLLVVYTGDCQAYLEPCG